MSTVVKRWTYDDLVVLPEDRLRHEIIDGEHITTPTPFTKHQVVVGNLLFCLGNYLQQHPIGEVLMYCDVIFAPDNVAVPDVFYISDERSSIVTERNIQGAPDLIAEVTSEVTRDRDAIQKPTLYERFGVVEYWIADPDADAMKIFRRGTTGEYEPAIELRDTLTSPLFPGLTIDVPALFR